MSFLLIKFFFVFYFFTFFTLWPLPVACFFQNFHFPRLLSAVKDKSATRSPQDVLEICWGDKKLTITPGAVPTLVEYFRLCSNAVYVLSISEEPLMMSLLRTKIYDTLPDVNKAFLYGTIGYEQAVAVQNALATVDEYMAQKGIPFREQRSNRWLKINRTTSTTLRSRVTSNIRGASSNPCRDLVVLDAVDKTNNATVKFIPTPYQDDPRNPRFMAIPFTKQSLYDIAKTESVGVLTRYYLQSEQCLITFSAEEVARFKQNMYNAIFTKFLPVIKANPYRIIPAYAGLLEILTDIVDFIESSNKTVTTNLTFTPSQIQFKQPQPLRLKKKHVIKQNGQHWDSEKWVWKDSDNSLETGPAESDMIKFYRWLLIFLTAICVFDGLFCLSTVAYYQYLRHRCLRRSTCPYVTRAECDSSSERHCTSESRKSQSTAWSIHAKDIISARRLRCPRISKDTACCHGKKEQSASNRSCRTDCGVQQIKCPHNLVSIRPTSPQDSPYCYPGTYIGMRPGEITMFKPPPCATNESTPCHQVFRCNTGTKKSQVDAVQSIQGCEEFQRIMRELQGLNRNFQDVLPQPNPNTGWNDSNTKPNTRS